MALNQNPGSVNLVPAPSEGRRPRGLVKLGGEVVHGWVSWETNNNVFSSADTFRVEFALKALPIQFDETWWAEQTTIQVEIYGGFPNYPDNYAEVDLIKLLTGNVDHIDYNPVTNTVMVQGRDLSALLIDTKTSEKFPNQTSSQIAETLAARHGLTPVVTATTTRAGTYYEIDHVALNVERSEWDLLTYLATQEQFVVYVRGSELHFEPKPSATGVPYLIQWQPPKPGAGSPVANLKQLKFSRDLTIAKGITVTVRSWHQQGGKAYTKTWPTKIARGVQPGQSAPAAQNYYFTIPNKTPDEALAIAQQKYAELIQHEMKLDAMMPADNDLDVTTVIVVEGTGTAFDQVYYPESITRFMSISDGYNMTVKAKNLSPGNQPVL